MEFVFRGTLVFVLLTKYYSGDKIKKIEIGWESGTCGGEDCCTQGFSGVGGNLSDKRPLGRHGHRKNDGRKCSPNTAYFTS
jgi:hypothetical protein